MYNQSNPKQKMKMKFIRLVSIVSIVSLAAAVSCNKHHDAEDGGKTSVRAMIGGYDGEGMSLEGEDALADISAFLFQDGTLVKVYDFEVSPSNTYEFTVDSRRGNLYVVGVREGEIPTEGLLEKGITEEEWKNSTSEFAGNPVQYYTGSVSIDGTSAPSNSASVSLKRGLARFDLAVESLDEVKVKSITFRNLAQAFNVFPSDEVSSPADPKRKDVTVSFDEPVAAAAEGILYAAEQVNGAIEVSVTATVGGVEKTMTKALSGDIRRNTAYKLTVRQDSIDLSLGITFDEWEDGGNTDIEVKGR